MWKFLQEDGARAVRIVYNPTIGHIAICRDSSDHPSTGWIAYLNDDYVNRTGEVAIYADTYEDLVVHAKFREVPTCGCEHICHELSLREHPMFREVINPDTARTAVHVGPICDHCADTHMSAYIRPSAFV